MRDGQRCSSLIGPIGDKWWEKKEKKNRSNTQFPTSSGVHYSATNRQYHKSAKAREHTAKSMEIWNDSNTERTRKRKEVWNGQANGNVKWLGNSEYDEHKNLAWLEDREYGEHGSLKCQMTRGQQRTRKSEMALFTTNCTIGNYCSLFSRRTGTLLLFSSGNLVPFKKKKRIFCGCVGQSKRVRTLTGVALPQVLIDSRFEQTQDSVLHESALRLYYC